MTVQKPGRGRWECLLVAGLLMTTACGSPVDQPPATTPPTSMPSGSPTQGEETSVEGTIAGGVEPDCLILRAQQDTYLLLGGDRAKLEPGKRVVVVGRPQPGMPTTCMQGTPFHVRTVTPAPAAESP
ncbi:hypothetical protein [Amycolatopsis keratiniphila]|uniref:Lipoprotein n=1 Tax=Amycolatopsis keratiniphila subsp. keratiniphila TaxID=227715 RepID=A0A1W2LWM1_9PSEU|nr:hypothetical protein [Amycolatopsis keratiniphila]OLZ58096.1 hypothetical protein BS330_12740 [Amycolatopsis keratiniphila subsp. nogabecina]ONF70432.1 hypothetical protein AVR91_0216565 [Amycolatopsis keratiniphila subsp. keratiniphila]SDU44037.1 hypothetical protein SAMN04489733_4284 [Amycolatopsis keratiniphila]